MRFTSTPRGARLARRLVSHRLDAWGHPYDGPVNETVTLIAAELAANAVRHGRVRGRDFHLWVAATADTVRLEVSDARGERLPGARSTRADQDEGGRGLLLVDALADRWGVTPRQPGKCVWAEVRLRLAIDEDAVDAPGARPATTHAPKIVTLPHPCHIPRASTHPCHVLQANTHPRTCDTQADNGTGEFEESPASAQSRGRRQQAAPLPAGRTAADASMRERPRSESSRSALVTQVPAGQATGPAELAPDGCRVLLRAADATHRVRCAQRAAALPASVW
ncbi:ATP-binding protein [Streptomyces sp. G45]|uniref:ATP-binding protein n=1 Tax=Streptomyces sp. G45 TaxID=3406627 RepID=UPI003C189BE3